MAEMIIDEVVDTLDKSYPVEATTDICSDGSGRSSHPKTLPPDETLKPIEFAVLDNIATGRNAITENHSEMNDDTDPYLMLLPIDKLKTGEVTEHETIDGFQSTYEAGEQESVEKRLNVDNEENIATSIGDTEWEMVENSVDLIKNNKEEDLLSFSSRAADLQELITEASLEDKTSVTYVICNEEHGNFSEVEGSKRITTNILDNGLDTDSHVIEEKEVTSVSSDQNNPEQIGVNFSSSGTNDDNNNNDDDVGSPPSREAESEKITHAAMPENESENYRLCLGSVSTVKEQETEKEKETQQDTEMEKEQEKEKEKERETENTSDRNTDVGESEGKGDTSEHTGPMNDSTMCHDSVGALLMYTGLQKADQCDADTSVVDPAYCALLCDDGAEMNMGTHATDSKSTESESVDDNCCTDALPLGDERDGSVVCMSLCVPVGLEVSKETYVDHEKDVHKIDSPLNEGEVGAESACEEGSEGVLAVEQVTEDVVKCNILRSEVDICSDREMCAIAVESDLECDSAVSVCTQGHEQSVVESPVVNITECTQDMSVGKNEDTVSNEMMSTQSAIALDAVEGTEDILEIEIISRVCDASQETDTDADQSCRVEEIETRDEGVSDVCGHSEVRTLIADGPGDMQIVVPVGTQCREVCTEEGKVENEEEVRGIKINRQTQSMVAAELAILERQAPSAEREQKEEEENVDKGGSMGVIAVSEHLDSREGEGEVMEEEICAVIAVDGDSSDQEMKMNMGMRMKDTATSPSTISTSTSRPLHSSFPDVETAFPMSARRANVDPSAPLIELVCTPHEHVHAHVHSVSRMFLLNMLELAVNNALTRLMSPERKIVCDAEVLVAIEDMQVLDASLSMSCEETQGTVNAEFVILEKHEVLDDIGDEGMEVGRGDKTDLMASAVDRAEGEEMVREDAGKVSHEGIIDEKTLGRCPVVDDDCDHDGDRFQSGEFEKAHNRRESEEEARQGEEGGEVRGKGNGEDEGEEEKGEKEKIGEGVGGEEEKGEEEEKGKEGEKVEREEEKREEKRGEESEEEEYDISFELNDVSGMSIEDIQCDPHTQRGDMAREGHQHQQEGDEEGKKEGEGVKVGEGGEHGGDDSSSLLMGDIFEHLACDSSGAVLADHAEKRLEGEGGEEEGEGEGLIESTKQQSEAQIRLQVQEEDDKIEEKVEEKSERGEKQKGDEKHGTEGEGQIVESMVESVISKRDENKGEYEGEDKDRATESLGTIYMEEEEREELVGGFRGGTDAPCDGTLDRRDSNQGGRNLDLDKECSNPDHADGSEIENRDAQEYSSACDGRDTVPVPHEKEHSTGRECNGDKDEEDYDKDNDEDEEYEEEYEVDREEKEEEEVPSQNRDSEPFLSKETRALDDGEMDTALGQGMEDNDELPIRKEGKDDEALSDEYKTCIDGADELLACASSVREVVKELELVKEVEAEVSSVQVHADVASTHPIEGRGRDPGFDSRAIVPSAHSDEYEYEFEDAVGAEEEEQDVCSVDVNDASEDVVGVHLADADASENIESNGNNSNNINNNNNNNISLASSIDADVQSPSPEIADVTQYQDVLRGANIDSVDFEIGQFMLRERELERDTVRKEERGDEGEREEERDGDSTEGRDCHSNKRAISGAVSALQTDEQISRYSDQCLRAPDADTDSGEKDGVEHDDKYEDKYQDEDEEEGTVSYADCSADEKCVSDNTNNNNNNSSISSRSNVESRESKCRMDGETAVTDRNNTCNTSPSPSPSTPCSTSNSSIKMKMIMKAYDHRPSVLQQENGTYRHIEQQKKEHAVSEQNSKNMNTGTGTHRLSRSPKLSKAERSILQKINSRNSIALNGACDDTKNAERLKVFEFNSAESSQYHHHGMFSEEYSLNEQRPTFLSPIALVRILQSQSQPLNGLLTKLPLTNRNRKIPIAPQKIDSKPFSSKSSRTIIVNEDDDSGSLPRKLKEKRIGRAKRNVLLSKSLSYGLYGCCAESQSNNDNDDIDMQGNSIGVGARRIISRDGDSTPSTSLPSASKSAPSPSLSSSSSISLYDRTLPKTDTSDASHPHPHSHTQSQSQSMQSCGSGSLIDNVMKSAGSAYSRYDMRSIFGSNAEKVTHSKNKNKVLRNSDLSSKGRQFDSVPRPRPPSPLHLHSVFNTHKTETSKAVERIQNNNSEDQRDLLPIHRNAPQGNNSDAFVRHNRKNNEASNTPASEKIAKIDYFSNSWREKFVNFEISNKNHDPALFKKSLESLKKLHSLNKNVVIPFYRSEQGDNENENYLELKNKMKSVKSSSFENTDIGKQNKFTELEYFTVFVDSDSSVEKGLKRLQDREYESEILFVCTNGSVDVKAHYAAMFRSTAL